MAHSPEYPSYEDYHVPDILAEGIHNLEVFSWEVYHNTERGILGMTAGLKPMDSDFNNVFIHLVSVDSRDSKDDQKYKQQRLFRFYEAIGLEPVKQVYHKDDVIGRTGDFTVKQVISKVDDGGHTKIFNSVRL